MTTTPPPSMIARVAAAIEATRARMDSVRDAVPRSKREPYFDKYPSKGPMKGRHVVGYRTKLLEAQARAAIESMRDPTDAMMDAASDTGDYGGIADNGGLERNDFDPAAVWEAMISAALEGK